MILLDVELEVGSFLSLLALKDAVPLSSFFVISDKKSVIILIVVP